MTVHLADVAVDALVKNEMEQKNAAELSKIGIGVTADSIGNQMDSDFVESGLGDSSPRSIGSATIESTATPLCDFAGLNGAIGDESDDDDDPDALWIPPSELVTSTLKAAVACYHTAVVCVSVLTPHPTHCSLLLLYLHFDMLLTWSMDT